jgi:hypothetical protein
MQVWPVTSPSLSAVAMTSPRQEPSQGRLLAWVTRHLGFRFGIGSEPAASLPPCTLGGNAENHSPREKSLTLVRLALGRGDDRRQAGELKRPLQGPAPFSPSPASGGTRKACLLACLLAAGCSRKNHSARRIIHPADASCWRLRGARGERRDARSQTPGRLSTPPLRLFS